MLNIYFLWRYCEFSICTALFICCIVHKKLNCGIYPQGVHHPSEEKIYIFFPCFLPPHPQAHEPMTLVLQLKDTVYILKFMFNWRMIALQYCVGFCRTSTWISHRCAYVLSLLSLPPISHPILPRRFSENTEFEVSSVITQIPTGCITYGNVYVSVLLSVRLIMSFPYCVHRFVYYVCLHCCPAYRFISTSFLDFIYMRCRSAQSLSCVWLFVSSWTGPC